MNEFICSRSSHRRYSVRKGVLRNFTKFTGKHLCQSLFFNKVAACRFITKNTFFTEYTRPTTSATLKVSFYLCFRALSPTTYYRRDERQHDLSVRQVDGILQHLEQWLNNQTNGGHTDMSEVSSVIDSVTDDHSNSYVRYKLADRLPLELIDQIDATSV